MVVQLLQDIGFEQDKKVFCLPRNIDESKGRGTNELIKKGAILVTSPDEILEELRINVKDSENSIINNKAYKDKVNNSLEDSEVNEENLKSVDDEYTDIYNLIPYYPVNIEYLARKSDLRMSQINQKLTMLELEGFIKSLPGNNYVRI